MVCVPDGKVRYRQGEDLIWCRQKVRKLGLIAMTTVWMADRMIPRILNYVEPSWKQLHSQRRRVPSLSRSCSRVQSRRDHEDQRRQELENSPHTEPGIAIYSPHCANRPKQRRLLGYLESSRYPISRCVRWLAQSGSIFASGAVLHKISPPPAGEGQWNSSKVKTRPRRSAR